MACFLCWCAVKNLLSLSLSISCRVQQPPNGTQVSPCFGLLLVSTASVFIISVIFFPARNIQHKRYECCSTGKFIICLSEEIHTCDTVVIYRHSKVEVIRSGHFTPGHFRTTSCSSAFPLSGVLVDKRANTYGFASGTTTADLVWISRSTAWRASGARECKHRHSSVTCQQI